MSIDRLPGQPQYYPESERGHDVEGSAIGKLSKTLGGGMSKEERNLRYFGKPPEGTYFGAPKDLAHAHDLYLSPDVKARLYGLPVKSGRPSEDLIETRLSSDSKSDLIRELCEGSNMTRSQATELIERWMRTNDLAEVNTPFGRIILPRSME